MPLLFKRTYKCEASSSPPVDASGAIPALPNNTFGATRDLLDNSNVTIGAGGGSKATPSSSRMDFFDKNAHVVTRTTHRWSYGDAQTHETCVVTLYTHYSLHVDVGTEGNGKTEESRRAALSSPPTASSTPSHTTAENGEGLCGVTWELVWMPDPSLVPSQHATDDASSQPCTPTAARFSFARTQPLCKSTLQGSGGVLFLSSRHVCIATEEEAAALDTDPARQASQQAPGLPHVLLDSFLLQSLVQPPPGHLFAGGATAAAAETVGWTRVAASVRLPCSLVTSALPGSDSPFPCVPTSSAKAQAAALMLLTGVPLLHGLPAASTAEEVVPLMRVLYAAAASPTTDTDVAASSIFIGVADLCGLPGMQAATPLTCVPRHAASESFVSLSLAQSRGSNAASVSSSSSSNIAPSAFSLSPSDFLWAYVEDVDWNRQKCSHTTQLYGSLVAVLPTGTADHASSSSTNLHDSPLGSGTAAAVVGTAPTAATSSHLTSSQSTLLLPCTGYRSDTPYGVIGAVSGALDALVKAESQGHARGAHTAGAASVLEDLLEELLPSSTRHVYEVVLGRPTERVMQKSLDAGADRPSAAPRGLRRRDNKAPSAAHTTPFRALPAQTSVLMFVCDGVVSRNADTICVAGEGLYMTETPTWSEVASAAAAAPHGSRADGALVQVCAVVLARTLWKGLTPIVLPSRRPPRQDAIPDVFGATASGSIAPAADAREAARQSPAIWDADMLAWELSDVPRFVRVLEATESAYSARPQRCSPGPGRRDEEAATPADVGGEDEGDEGERDTTWIAASSSSINPSRSPAAAAATTPLVTCVASWRRSLGGGAAAATEDGTSCVCFPRLHPTTKEWSVWYYVEENKDNGGEKNAAYDPIDRERQRAAAAGTACVPPPPLRSFQDTDKTTNDALRDDWEAAVAEWVISHLLDGYENTTADLDTGVDDTGAYRAIKLLWAYAIRSAFTSSSSGIDPHTLQWPRVLLEVVRHTSTEAAEPSSRLHVYAKAARVFVAAQLPAVKAEAEMAHFQHTAAVFLRLVLRALAELDCRAANAKVRSQVQFVAQWCLGQAAGVSRADATASSTDRAEGTATVLAEGLALQVVLQLATPGAWSSSTASTHDSHATGTRAADREEEDGLSWMRRMILLYSCRVASKPLELTLEDVLDASGLLLATATTAAAPQHHRDTQSDWSEAEDQEEEDAATAAPPRRNAQDAAEWRESMEYALLRMVDVDALYCTVQLLSNVPHTSMQRAGSFQWSTRGLLTVADVHDLLCVRWTAEQLQDAAPLGFSFVCLLVDVALTALTTAPAAASCPRDTPNATAAAATEAYERLACDAVDAWQQGRSIRAAAEAPATAPVDADAEYTPVYPLLSLCASQHTTRRRRANGNGAVTDTSVPFPFSTLPPLLTTYVWYVVADRLCTSLRLLPKDELAALSPSAAVGKTASPTRKQSSNSHARPSEAVRGDEEIEEEAAPWQRRGRAEAAVLQGLHRGVSVLLCLTQANPVAAEEMFAAMQLICAADGERREADGNGEALPVAGDTRQKTWGSRYLVAWQHLLSLTAPPLCSQRSLLRYREGWLAAAEGDTGAALVRVLHLVYASAGSGHALRVQLRRAVGGRTTLSPVLLHSEASVQTWRRQGAAFPVTAATATQSPVQQAREHNNKSNLAPDAVGPWLVQVWAHVLLCDAEAVTDVGIYEHIYTAFAHLRQQLETAHTSPANDKGGFGSASTGAAATAAGWSGKAADVAFAVLRPCLLYAYPLLRQLAVADELLGSPDLNRNPRAYHGSPRSTPAAESPDSTNDFFVLPQFPQFNEPLVWRCTWDGGNGPAQARESPPTRALEQLCAGEVCERTRRQLGRLTGLFEAPTATHRAGDPRFRALVHLLSLQPSVLEVAQRQLQWGRLQSEEGVLTAGNEEGSRASSSDHARRSTPAQTSSYHSWSSSQAGSSSDSEDNMTMELSTFSLSPVAAYVTATFAATCRSRDEASGVPEPPQLGWFTVQCEALRRELRRYAMTELLRGKLLVPLPPSREAHAPSAAEPDAQEAQSNKERSAPPSRWRLAASEKEVKAFMNALADAVEPLTQALVLGVGVPLYQSVVLLLVLDVVHHVLFADAGDGDCLLEAEEHLLGLVRGWIGQAAQPLYAKLSVPDQKAVLHVVTAVFAEAYLGSAEASSRTGTRPPPIPAAACPVANVSASASTSKAAAYANSAVHAKWQRWREEVARRGVRIGAAVASREKTDAAMVEGLEACVPAEYRCLLHRRVVSQPAVRASSVQNGCGSPTSQADVTRDGRFAGHRGSAEDTATRKHRRDGVGEIASWIKAGSALRTSLFQTIGATVAPRPVQQQPQLQGCASPATSSPRNSPQPAPATEETLQRPLMPPPLAAKREEALASTVASPVHNPSPTNVSSASPILACASVDVAEAVPLLCKEEAFKRRQLTAQLLEAQQKDLLTRPAFQQALVSLYLTMRVEKRRKELVSFVLDQHDLICAFASREQQVVRDRVRRELRQAWVDYGERQRLALERLRQEERDARMSVLALAFACRQDLVQLEQREGHLWMLEEEGRTGLCLLEEDARDDVRGAAARERVALARRAVEAEEAAYWKAEEEAWARMEREEGPKSGEKEDDHRGTAEEQKRAGGGDEFAARQAVVATPIQAQTEGRVSATTGKLTKLGKKGLGVGGGDGGGAAALVALHSTTPAGTALTTAPPSLTSLPQDPHAQEVPPARASPPSESERISVGGCEMNPAERSDTTENGLAHALAQAAADAGVGGLFHTFSRWQTAVRETVAPAPPTRKSSTLLTVQHHKMPPSTSATDVHPSPIRNQPAAVPTVRNNAEKTALPAAHVASHPHPTVNPDAAQKLIPETEAAEDDDDWGWGPDRDSDALVLSAAPTLTAAAAARPLLAAVAASTADEYEEEGNTAKDAAPQAPVAAAIIPLHAHPHEKSSAGLDGSRVTLLPAGAQATQPPLQTSPNAATSKPARKKKGLAAAVLLEPVVSTAHAAALDAAMATSGGPPIPAPVQPQPSHAPASPSPAPPHQQPPPFPAPVLTGDATPNPVRSILPAMEEEMVTPVRSEAIEAKWTSSLRTNAQLPPTQQPQQHAKETKESTGDVAEWTPQESIRWENNDEDNDETLVPLHSDGENNDACASHKVAKEPAHLLSAPSHSAEASLRGTQASAEKVVAPDEVVSAPAVPVKTQREVAVKKRYENAGWGWSEDEVDLPHEEASRAEAGVHREAIEHAVAPDVLHTTIEAASAPVAQAAATSAGAAALPDDRFSETAQTSFQAAGDAATRATPISATRESEAPFQPASVHDGWGWSDGDDYDGADLPQPAPSTAETEEAEKLKAAASVVSDSAVGNAAGTHAEHSESGMNVMATDNNGAVAAGETLAKRTVPPPSETSPLLEPPAAGELGLINYKDGWGWSDEENELPQDPPAACDVGQAIKPERGDPPLVAEEFPRGSDANVAHPHTDATATVSKAENTAPLEASDGRGCGDEEDSGAEEMTKQHGEAAEETKNEDVVPSTQAQLSLCTTNPSTVKETKVGRTDPCLAFVTARPTGSMNLPAALPSQVPSSSHAGWSDDDMEDLLPRNTAPDEETADAAKPSLGETRSRDCMEAAVQEAVVTELAIRERMMLLL